MIDQENQLRKRHFGKRPRPTGPRTNGRIRISPVFVVTADGTKLGVMPTDQARAKAEELGLDLVEVSPNARPPVCYGKFKYDEKKRKPLARGLVIGASSLGDD